MEGGLRDRNLCGALRAFSHDMIRPTHSLIKSLRESARVPVFSSYIKRLLARHSYQADQRGSIKISVRDRA